MTCAVAALKALINKATVASHFSLTGIHGLAMTFASFEQKSEMLQCFTGVREDIVREKIVLFIHPDLF